MLRVYFAALIGAAIFLSYVVGVHVGRVRCDAHVANAAVQQIVRNANILENANEIVFHTGVSDVRRVLREKYTIAD